MKYVHLSDSYRIKRRDKFNWEIQKLRTGKVDKGGEQRWFPCGKFYQSLDGAMRAVYEMMLKEGDECADLGQAVSTCKEIKSEITRVAWEVAANAN